MLEAAGEDAWGRVARYCSTVVLGLGAIVLHDGVRGPFTDGSGALGPIPGRHLPTSKSECLTWEPNS
eukprot:15434536-Alexandrium_andersonii.AAC.1